jgi:hypothetical protein
MTDRREQSSRQIDENPVETAAQRNFGRHQA